MKGVFEMSETNKKTAIELKYPVTIDGTEVSVLHMRRPKVRDQLLMDKAGKVGKSEGEREVLLFANLCEIAPESLEGVDMSDYRKLQEAYTSFLEG